MSKLEFRIGRQRTVAAPKLRNMRKGYPRDVQRMYNGCTRDVQGMYKGCTRDVQGMYKGCTRDVQGMYKGTTRSQHRSNAGATRSRRACTALGTRAWGRGVSVNGGHRPAASWCRRRALPQGWCPAPRPGVARWASFARLTGGGLLLCSRAPLAECFLTQRSWGCARAGYELN